MFRSYFARVIRQRSFPKNFATSIYIPKYALSKRLICSINVLHLFENLEKIRVQEFNVSINVLSVGAATILKNINSFIA